MNSEWFKKYEADHAAMNAEDKAQANGQAKQKLIILPIVFTIMCGLLVMAMLTGPNANPSAAGIIGVIYAMLMFMSFMLIMKKKNAKTGLEMLKSRLDQYITTPELEKMLDTEMMSQPLDSMRLHSGEVVCFTEHFFYVLNPGSGELMLAPYTAIRYKDYGIINGQQRMDIMDASKKMLFGLDFMAKEQAAFEELFKKYLPNVKRK